VVQAACGTFRHPALTRHVRSKVRRSLLEKYKKGGRRPPRFSMCCFTRVRACPIVRQHALQGVDKIDHLIDQLLRHLEVLQGVGRPATAINCLLRNAQIKGFLPSANFGCAFSHLLIIEDTVTQQLSFQTTPCSAYQPQKHKQLQSVALLPLSESSAISVCAKRLSRQAPPSLSSAGYQLAQHRVRHRFPQCKCRQCQSIHR
jgi:hypothetical protein